jgi:hypothetical protein
MVCSVKQLTDRFCYITVWQRSAFTSAFPTGEQKKLKWLTLNSLLSIPGDYADLLMSIKLPCLSGSRCEASYSITGADTDFQLIARTQNRDE